MDRFNTTSRDDYRDPSSYSKSDFIAANEDARARRRKGYECSPTRHLQDRGSRHVSVPSTAVHTWPKKQQALSSLSLSGSYSPRSSSLRDLKPRADISVRSMGDSLERIAAKVPRRSGGHIHESDKTAQLNEDSYINQPLLDLEDQIRATIYGHCIGDAIGLLTEFMSQDEAHQHYGKHGWGLEFEDKVNDRHRRRWAVGDWTDDSDQMILIMQSFTDNKGKVSATDFASRLQHWMANGFSELGDTGGLGIGYTTHKTVRRHGFKKDPHKAAKQTWEESGKTLAPNGGVMRTSILGIHEFWDLDKVTVNATEICNTTHCDPRCLASVVSVCVAIALMLQRRTPYFDSTTGQYNTDRIIDKCFDSASPLLSDSNQIRELDFSLRCTNLDSLRLDDESSIGYTFKCLGAGFWALKQTDFRKALTKIVMCAGDADTNGAVAGALLGCKLQKTSHLPASWYNNLKHRQWLNEQIARYLTEFRRMLQKSTSWATRL